MLRGLQPIYLSTQHAKLAKCTHPSSNMVASLRSQQLPSVHGRLKGVAAFQACPPPLYIYIYVYVKHLTAWCTGLRWLWVNEQNAFPMWMWVFSRGEGLLQDRFDGLWLQKGRPKDPQLGVRFSSHARHSRKTLKGILFWSIIDPPCTVPS